MSAKAPITRENLNEYLKAFANVNFFSFILETHLDYFFAGRPRLRVGFLREA